MSTRTDWRSFAVRVERAAQARGAELGLIMQEEPFFGEHLLIRMPDGSRREVHLDLESDEDGQRYWRDVEAIESIALAEAIKMVVQFHRKHGPGRVWSLAGEPIVHLVHEDWRYAMREPNADRVVVRLRRAVAHEAQSVPCNIAVDDILEECRRTGHVVRQGMPRCRRCDATWAEMQR